jgi:hypothetical protein
MEALLQRSRLKESQSTSFQLQRISGSQQTHQHRRWKPFFKSCAWVSRFDELSNIREVHATIYMIITSSLHRCIACCGAMENYLLHRVLRSHAAVLSARSWYDLYTCTLVQPPLQPPPPHPHPPTPPHLVSLPCRVVLGSIRQYYNSK